MLESECIAHLCKEVRDRLSTSRETIVLISTHLDHESSDRPQKSNPFISCLSRGERSIHDDPQSGYSPIGRIAHRTKHRMQEKSLETWEGTRLKYLLWMHLDREEIRYEWHHPSRPYELDIRSIDRSKSRHRDGVEDHFGLEKCLLTRYRCHSLLLSAIDIVSPTIHDDFVIWREDLSPELTKGSVANDANFFSVHTR